MEYKGICSDDVLNKRIYTTSERNQYVEEQMKEERERLLQRPPINTNIVLDFATLEKLTQEFPYNPTMLKLFEDYTTSLTQTKDNVRNEQIRKFYSNPKVINVRSAFGIAMNTELDATGKRPFIIKTSKSGYVADIIHEAFVGLFALNRLRMEIPNFVYVFGYVEGRKIYIEDSGDVYGWLTSQPKEDIKDIICTESEDSLCPYLLEENIYASFPLSRCKVYDFLEIYLQVLLAVNYAYKQCGFTHYDLHSDNVLVRKLVRKYYIRYPYVDGYVYVYTDYIPVIIDYGRVRVVVDGKVYGDQRLVDNSLTPAATYAYPYFDAYKLLMWTLYYLKKSYKHIDELLWLYEFFSNENFYQALDREKIAKYSIPAYNELINRSLDDFIDYIVRRKPDLITKERPKDHVLDCSYIKCTTSPPESSSSKPSIFRMFRHGDANPSLIQEDVLLALDDISAKLRRIEDIDINDLKLVTPSVNMFNPISYAKFLDRKAQIHFYLDTVYDIESIYNVATSLMIKYNLNLDTKTVSDLAERILKARENANILLQRIQTFRSGLSNVRVPDEYSNYLEI